MKKYTFTILIALFLIGYFLLYYLKEDSNELVFPQTEESQSNIIQESNTESDNLGIREPYLDEGNVNLVYLTFIRTGDFDEFLQKLLEWNEYIILLEGYFSKLEKDTSTIENTNFIMYFFIDELYQGAKYYEKNYSVKYYTVLYKTPMSSTIQGEKVEFDAYQLPMILFLIDLYYI